MGSPELEKKGGLLFCETASLFAMWGIAAPLKREELQYYTAVTWALVCSVLGRSVKYRKI